MIFQKSGSLWSKFISNIRCQLVQKFDRKTFEITDFFYLT